MPNIDIYLNSIMIAELGEDVRGSIHDAIEIMNEAVDEGITEAAAMVGTPLVASTASDMEDETKIYVYTGDETGYVNGNWYYWNGSAWASGGIYNTNDAINTLAQSVSNLEDDISDVQTEIGDLANLNTTNKTNLVAAINDAMEYSGSSSGLTDTEKSLILELFSKAAYVEDDASEAYEELTSLWSSYSITWSGVGYIHSNNATSIEKDQAFVSTITANTGFIINEVVVRMGGNTVQGAWSNGTVSIPIVTGDIVITVATTQATVTGVSAVYTQSGTVYDTDSLESLTSDLVVTATYADSSTYVVPASGYTLSGTLSAGTSTITVSYGGKTTTFTVTVSSEEWTVVREIGSDIITGCLVLSDGTTSSDGSWRTSAYIEVPDGATAFYRTTSRESDWYLCWYDSEQVYIGNGLNGTYSGNGTYGGGYTDDEHVWNVIPVTAKYARVSWRYNATYTSLTFKRYPLLDQNKTPVTGKIYHMEYDAESTDTFTSPYLKCAGMTYAQIRPVIRRKITFYDEDFIQVSEIATANNTGNNVAIPSDAVYLKCGVSNVKTLSASNVSIVGQRLIQFTDTTKDPW